MKMISRMLEIIGTVFLVAIDQNQSQATKNQIISPEEHQMEIEEAKIIANNYQYSETSTLRYFVGHF